MSRILLTIALLIASGVRLNAADAPSKQSAPVAPKSAVGPRIPDTLMFGIDELNDIQSRATAVQGASDKKEVNESTIENATLYLSTIVFYGPADWTAWINGVPIGPRQEFQAFKVTDVGPEFVQLVVPLSAQGMRPVRLAPNQTFIAKTGAVVEGQWK